MTYSKTTWLEHSMSTAEKLAALDNLEGMYSEAIDYIDAITHSSRYYTKTEAAAKYFTADDDGSGSGLICATLDGHTAQAIIDAGTPSGCIGLWSGSVASIPANWYLCNGLNGTPDLRDRFVVGAGGNYAKGATGGANSVTTTASITIGSTTLTTAQIPKHTHSTITDYYQNDELWAIGDGGGRRTDKYKIGSNTTETASCGGGGSHTHDATWSGSSQTKMPPYYALCWIMRA